MGKNYLPFANRIVMELPLGQDIVPAEFSALDIGVQTGGRAILQDLCIKVAYAGKGDQPYLQGQVGLRYGFLERGFLTSRHIPIDVYMDDGYPMYQTWELVRPYRLFSKERLGVGHHEIHDDITMNNAGTTFNCVNRTTQLPYILHEATFGIHDDEASVFNAFDTLRAPHDADLDIYSVCFSENIFGNQVMGPGRRPWFNTSSQDQGLALFNYYEYLDWARGTGTLIGLGEKDGWYLEPNQTFMLDMIDWSGGQNTYQAVVTLRGVLEVEDDRI